MSDMVLPGQRRYAIYLNRVLLTVIEIATLCFPAFINSAPMVYPDTRSYFMGGRAAIEKIISLFHHADASGGSGDLTIQKARGVRSAFYSLFTYIPTVSISLWLVIILQALIVATLLRLLFRLVHPARPIWHPTLFITSLSLFTTVSWATSNIMPDIFTSMMAISIIMTIVYWQRPIEVYVKHKRTYDILPRKLMILVIGGCMVMHMTNLPIAVGLVIIGMIVMRAHPLFNREPYQHVTWGILGGVLAMLAVGVVGFHQWSLAPQSPPFLLARSLADGPAKLYLRDHCPQIKLAMCNHLDKLDQESTVFLWDQKVGVYSTASVEEEAELRAEDKRIYIAAAIEHPWLQIKTMAANAFRQLITFTLHEYYIPSYATYSSSDMSLSIADQAPWQTYLSIVEYAVVFGCLGGIFTTWRQLSKPLKRVALLVFATVLLEALAGAISEPAPRYEARVIWLIPMMAGLIWAQSWSEQDD